MTTTPALTRPAAAHLLAGLHELPAALELSLTGSGPTHLRLLDRHLPERRSEIHTLLAALAIPFLEVDGTPLVSADVPAIDAALRAPGAPTLLLLIEPGRATFHARLALSALIDELPRLSLIELARPARPTLAELIPSQR